jgi:hypothetical protein
MIKRIRQRIGCQGSASALELPGGNTLARRNCMLMNLP